ncbi:MAG: hypothetical protein ACK5ZT_05305 [Sphingobacteriaceae bacterium]
MNKRFNANIRIVAFLSVKELIKTSAKSELKKLSPRAIVLPAFPGLKNFEYTFLFLLFVCLFTGERNAICRNIFCTRVALKVKRLGLLKKVVLDGRSAMSAEIKEYDVFPVDYLRSNAVNFESDSVSNCDFRIAVSEKLVQFWRDQFNYTASDHVVIPCTLDTKHFQDFDNLRVDKNSDIRRKLGFEVKDVVYVYSGSNAPWQSFDLIEKFISEIIVISDNAKFLFLSKKSLNIERLILKYPDRIKCVWLDHKLVPFYLSACDYGLLLRNNSVTNFVASPVKFAEYLFCGLKIIISESIGDLSDFVIQHNCGYTVSNDFYNIMNFGPVTVQQKQNSKNLAIEYFSKDSEVNKSGYRKLLNSFSN